jgi:hypothetical protein
MTIKPIGGMLLVTKKQEEDKTTKSGLVISAVFNDSGPKDRNYRRHGCRRGQLQGRLDPYPRA